MKTKISSTASKKLSLAKETLRSLSGPELDGVVGGSRGGVDGGSVIGESNNPRLGPCPGPSEGAGKFSKEVQGGNGHCGHPILSPVLYGDPAPVDSGGIIIF